MDGKRCVGAAGARLRPLPLPSPAQAGCNNAAVPRRPILILLALVLLGAAAGLVLALRGPQVAAVAVQPAALVRTLQFSARVATASRVDIGSTLTGRVQTVAVTEGARVTAGALLLQLEDDELRAALSQALANEQQAAARLAGLRSTGRSGVQAGVDQAESVLAAAREADARDAADPARTPGHLASHRGSSGGSHSTAGEDALRIEYRRQLLAIATLDVEAAEPTDVLPDIAAA